MSSSPGLTLEEYLKWYFRVDNDLDKELLAIFEEYREPVEAMLLDFNEDSQSWRGYSQYVEERIPKEIWGKANEWLKSQMSGLNEAYDKLVGQQKPIPAEIQTLLSDNLPNLRLE